MLFEPISYDHAARLIEKRPWEVSRHEDLLVSAHIRAMDTYNYNVCVVGLDIYNVEAEAYGCRITDSGGNGVPTAGGPILNGLHEITQLQLDPRTDGRIPMVLSAAQRIAAERPDAEVRIPLSGPFTIACHVIGIENMIMALATQPQKTAEALTHLAGYQVTYGSEAVGRGFKVSLFESSVTPPLLSPQLFREAVKPHLMHILDTITDSEPDGQMIIGGDTIHILDDIQGLPASYIICPFETDQETFMSRLHTGDHRTVRINMDPSVFLPSKQKQALSEAERVFTIAQKYPNTTTGTILPFEADPHIVHRISDIIKNKDI